MNAKVRFWQNLLNEWVVISDIIQGIIAFMIRLLLEDSLFRRGGMAQMARQWTERSWVQTPAEARKIEKTIQKDFIDQTMWTSHCKV